MILEIITKRNLQEPPLNGSNLLATEQEVGKSKRK